jgi:hypothetical protein
MLRCRMSFRTWRDSEYAHIFLNLEISQGESKEIWWTTNICSFKSLLPEAQGYKDELFFFIK